MDKSKIREPELRKNTRKPAKDYTLKVIIGTELHAALEEATKDYGNMPGKYLRVAFIEKLQRDGLLPPDFKENNRQRPVD